MTPNENQSIANLFQEIFDQIECTADLLAIASRDLDLACGRETANSMSAIIDHLRELYGKGTLLTVQLEKAQAAAN